MNLSSQLTPSDVSNVLRAIGVEAIGRSADEGWTTIKSPLREECSPSFGFNRKTGAWTDHGTGEKGDIVTLVKLLKNFDDREALHWITEQTGIDPQQNGRVCRPKKQPESAWTSEKMELIRSGQEKIRNTPDHALLKQVKRYDCIEPETLEKFGCGIINLWGHDWLAFPYETGCQLYRRDESGKVIRSIKGSVPADSWFGIKRAPGNNPLLIAKSPRETMLLSQLIGDRVDVIGVCTGEQGNMTDTLRAKLQVQISKRNYSRVVVLLDGDTDQAREIAQQFAGAVREAVGIDVRLVNVHSYSSGKYKDVTDMIRAGAPVDMINDMMSQAESVNNANNANSATPKSGTFDEQLKVETAPRIPDEAYNSLPETLRTRCSLIPESHRRDTFLMASLPVVAAHMPNVLAGHSDGYYTPDIYTMIIAPPGTGKAIATKARRLGEALNKEIIEQCRHEKQNYESLPDEEKTKIEPPRSRTLFIPANSSSRAVYDTLDANGGWGLLHETEIDTLLSATNQEWGNFSDVCRKAFHHENISINRKGELFFIDYPRLSICMSGTPDQFQKMFESAENGHFSRYALYTFSTERLWQSHRPTKQTRQLDDSIETASESLCNMYETLSGRFDPLYIDLTPEQWDSIDATFGEKMQIIEDFALSPFLHASNNRAAVLALRMATMFCVLRRWEDSPDTLKQATNLTPGDDDIFAAIYLADTFIKHAIRLFHILPKSEAIDGKGERYTAFIAALPDEFTTGEAIQIATSMDIPERTAKRWLNSLRRIGHGRYKKQ